MYISIYLGNAQMMLKNVIFIKKTCKKIDQRV